MANCTEHILSRNTVAVTTIVASAVP